MWQMINITNANFFYLERFLFSKVHHHISYSQGDFTKYNSLHGSCVPVDQNRAARGVDSRLAACRTGTGTGTVSDGGQAVVKEESQHTWGTTTSSFDCVCEMTNSPQDQK